MAHHVDGDRRDAAAREYRGDGQRSSLLTVGEPMPEDRDRPAPGGGWPGGDDQVEFESVGPLGDRHAGARPDRRDELFRCLPVRRLEVAESDGAHPGHDAQRRKWDGRNAGERRRIREVRLNLAPPLDRRQAGEREGGAYDGGRRVRLLDLAADLLEHRRGALGAEHAGRDDIVLADPGPLDRLAKVPAVVAERAEVLSTLLTVEEVLELLARDALPVGVAHA